MLAPSRQKSEVVHTCVCAILRGLLLHYTLLIHVRVTMMTKPLTLQEQEDRRQTWPGQQYPPSYQNIGKCAASCGCLHPFSSCCLIHQGCMETCSGVAKRHQTCREKILNLLILLCRPAEQREQSALALAC